MKVNARWAVLCKEERKGSAEPDALSAACVVPIVLIF